MPKFKIELEEFCEDIFGEMERVQDGKGTHTVIFEGADKEMAALRVATRLRPFIQNSMTEVEEDE
jgi:hypothetical protein